MIPVDYWSKSLGIFKTTAGRPHLRSEIQMGKAKGLIQRYNRLMRRRGLAGLDTAIILIAFIITASVLAFVAINMGLFVTQKAKTTIDKGEQTASTALQLSSSVLYAANFPANTESYWIYFTVSPSSGVSSVQLSPSTTSISFTAPSENISYSNIYVYSLLGNTSNIAKKYLSNDTTGGMVYYYYSSPGAALLALNATTKGLVHVYNSTNKPTSASAAYLFSFNYSGKEYYVNVTAKEPIAITFPVAGDPLVGSDVAPAGSTIGVIILFPTYSPLVPVFQYQTITIQIIPNIGSPLTLSEYVYQPDGYITTIG